MLKSHISTGLPEPSKLVPKNYNCRNCRSGDLGVFLSAPKYFFIIGLQNSFLEFGFNNVGFKKIWW